MRYLRIWTAALGAIEERQSARSDFGRKCCWHSNQSRNLPNWVTLLCLLAIASTSLAGPVDAQEDVILGAWQQIESNAGACPKCRISIAQKGASLSVVSNNGWSAVVGVEGAKGPIEATGAGEWAPGKIGRTAGRRFNVVFRLVDQRLYMSMRVEMEHGSRRLIKAVFGRVWFGA